MNSDYYAILGVSKTATQAELKAAYVRLSKALHPDVNPNGAALMQAVNEAYEVLGDEKKRKEYDRFPRMRKVAPMPPPTPQGAGTYGVNQDGSFNLSAMAANVMPEAMQKTAIPAFERFLSEVYGIAPQAARVEQVLQAFGVLKKKRKTRKTA